MGPASLPLAGWLAVSPMGYNEGGCEHSRV